MVAIVTIPTNETVPANAIYASANGSATAAGTEAAPCSLVAAIGKAATSGSTIVLTGVASVPYRVGSISLGKSIKFIAKPGDSPVLSGARLVAVTDVDVETSTGLYYFSQTSLPAINEEAIDPAYPQSANRQFLSVNNVNYTQVKTKAELAPLTFYYQPPTTGNTVGRIYVKDNITASGTRIEAASKMDTFFFNNGSGGCQFIGLGFERYGNTVGLIQVDNVTFDRCSFYHMTYFGINSQLNDKLTVKKCRFMYTGSNAISNGRDGTNWLIENNVIGYSNQNRHEDIYNAAGMKIVNSHINLNPVTQNFIIRRNLVFETLGAPNIWLDINCTGYQVYDNVCWKGSMGIFLEISGSPTQKNYLVNNFCFDNGTGIFLSHTQNTDVANNVCSNNGVDFKFKDDNRPNPVPEQVAKGFDWNTRHNRVYNNIFNGSRNLATGALVEGTSGDSRPSTDLVSELNNNAYYRNDTRQVIYKGWNDRNYATLTDFKNDPANAGYDTESIGRTVEASNPFFESATSTVQKSTSPALGKGKAVTGIVAQILGVPSGTVVDIGNVRPLSADLSGQTTPPPEPPTEPEDPCASAIEDATSELRSQLALTTDNLRAANAQVASLTSERDAAVLARNEALTQKDAVLAAHVTLKSQALTDLTAVKLLVEERLSAYQ